MKNVGRSLKQLQFLADCEVIRNHTGLQSLPSWTFLAARMWIFGFIMGTGKQYLLSCLVGHPRQDL